MPLRWYTRCGSLGAHVAHEHARRPCLKTQAHDFRHHFRIRVGSLLRRAVPSHVRLDGHDIAALDEAAHSAQRFERAADGCARLSPLNDHQIRRVRAGRRSQVAPEAHRQRLFGTSASAAQPHGCSRRACAEHAHPKELNQGLPARHQRQLGRHN
jgi:hypothetical protein